MNRQKFIAIAEEKLERLKAASDHEMLDRAWEELSALCGSRQRPKSWQMSIPVNADRDSDIIFGEVLGRFAELVGYSLEQV